MNNFLLKLQTSRDINLQFPRNARVLFHPKGGRYSTGKALISHGGTLFIRQCIQVIMAAQLSTNSTGQLILGTIL